MTVKILDAGGKLMLSSDSRDDVQSELQKRLSAGAKLISDLARIGSSWVAACSLPPTDHAVDTTSTLKLADLQAHTRDSVEMPDFEDGCTVVEIGFKRLITGPSKRAVELRYTHLKAKYGAELVGEIEPQDNEWVGVVDVGGADKDFRF